MQRPHELRDQLKSASFTGASGVKYQIIELLGEGGNGWVFKASQDGAEAPFVVVKVLRPELVGSEAFARFEREAAVLRAFSSGPSPHPHIVRFIDHGRAQIQGPSAQVELPYLVLEHIDGPPLSRVLAAHGGFGLPAARVRRIFRQVVRALCDMHAQNIIHRDLKPSNILLAPREATEIAKVTDFGLVKVVDGSTRQTQALAGATTGYAPPEQYEAGNRRVGPPTDVFAMGAILFEALSGCEAFPVAPGETALRLVARMLTGDRPALTKVSATVARELRDRPELTAALDREIARATDGDPERRHASIEELWNAVEPILRAVSSGPGPLGKRSDPPSADNPVSGVAVSGPSTPHPAPSSAAPGAPASRLLGKPMTGERLRGAVFANDARSLVAVGAYGLYRFQNGVWSAMRAPRGIDTSGLRGILRLSGGDLLLFGDGFAVSVSSSGATASIDPAGGDVVWLGAHADSAGIVLVGERRSTSIGAVAQLVAGSAPVVRDIRNATRLHAAVRLGSGSTLVCGAHGALFVLDGGEVQEIVWSRTGHLVAAAPAPDGGAYVVGSGGHALSIAPPHPSLRGVAPPATLEAVQTTRDLASVMVDSAGIAWASGAQSRLLVRHEGIWSRIVVDATNETLIALAPGVRAAGEVIALAEDGAVIEIAPA